MTASNGLIMTGIVEPKQKWEEEEADGGAEWRGNIKRDMVEWMAGTAAESTGGKNGDMVMGSRSVCMHAPQVFFSLAFYPPPSP